MKRTSVGWGDSQPRDYDALAEAIKGERAITDEQARIIEELRARSAAAVATAKGPADDIAKGK